MKRLILFFIFFAVWVSVAGAQSIITIEVYDNGNAFWIMEKRLPLTNQTEIDYWDEFIRKGQDANSSAQDISEFRQRIDWFLGSAEKSAKRPMKAEKFNISYDMVKTPSDTYGIIRYSFKWNNFSRHDSQKMFIGDSFLDGMVLSSDNVLVIKIPDGYEVTATSPGFDKRDGNRLIWDGTLYRSFGKGEPALVLSHAGTGYFSWFAIAIVMVGLLSGASFLIWKRSYKRDLTARDNADAPPVAANTDLVAPQAKEDMEDEEMIEQFLIKHGGEAYQSRIVKESRFSKSKISLVLAKMKDEGRILKIKKGKENLIRLANK
ncbi:MAG: hypothetical protein FIB08_11900 [Candidatus Methanoperedens sp.]|nr:hypothetical protein [Candidatus Methanoperedens sp.]